MENLLQAHILAFGLINFGIPTYQDMGLISSTCSWHDTSPVICQVQGGKACLWGCTNIDPVLGWHEKYFSSKTALKNEILPKGYHQSSFAGSGMVAPSQTDFTRTLSYGFRYQIYAKSVDANGKGTWTNEGPESNPEFTWYTFLNDWWPEEILYWHEGGGNGGC